MYFLVGGQAVKKKKLIIQCFLVSTNTEILIITNRAMKRDRLETAIMLKHTALAINNCARTAVLSVSFSPECQAISSRLLLQWRDICMASRILSAGLEMTRTDWYVLVICMRLLDYWAPEKLKKSRYNHYSSIALSALDQPMVLLLPCRLYLNQVTDLSRKLQKLCAA